MANPPLTAAEIDAIVEAVERCMDPCECSECRHDARSHAANLNIERLREQLATLRQELSERQK